MEEIPDSYRDVGRFRASRAASFPKRLPSFAPFIGSTIFRTVPSPIFDHKDDGTGTDIFKTDCEKGGARLV